MRTCATIESGGPTGDFICQGPATHTSTALCGCGHLKTTDICEPHARSTESRLVLGEQGRMVCGPCWRDESAPHPCMIMPTLALIDPET